MGDSEKLSKAVGRLILGKVSGTELEAEEIEALRFGIMGGITLFKNNAVGLEQLAGLVSSIRQHAHHEPVIAVDQEGGSVQRFDTVLTPLPSAMALAASGDLNAVKTIAALSATQLRLIGVNCLIWPVLDVLTNSLNPVIGTRSFGSDPHLVREFSMAAARSLKTSGVLAVGKHFPGHGDTLEDSHKRLAVNRADGRTLWQRELVPFRGCIQYLPAILTGHIWLPAVDDQELPASLSQRVTSGLLRHYLGFDGLVITDDLLMEAVAHGWGLEESAVAAVLAGADLLLVCGSISAVRTVHDALVKAVLSGRIHESLVRAAGERVRRALSTLPPVSASVGDQLLERMETLRGSLAVARSQVLSVSTSAIALLRGSILPDLLSGTWTVLAPDHPTYALNLAKHLTGLAPSARIVERRYPVNPAEEEIRAIATALAGKSVVFLTFRALRNHGQLDLATALFSVCERKLAVAADVPHDLIGLPGWDTCLASFDPSDLAMEALARVLAGRASLAGKCPVELQINV